MNGLVNMRYLRSTAPRRIVLITLIVICLILTLFPQRYRAASTLTPSDPSSLGLAGTLGQLGAINNVFGNQAAIEIALRIGHSVYVRDTVAQKLGLMKRLNFSNRVQMHRWLEANITLRSLRGGILLMETTNRDPQLASELIGAYAEATRTRLAEINRRQTEYKRDILLQLVADSSDRLASAQAAYNSFRLQTRYGNPEQAIEAIGERIPVLEAAIKAKQVQLGAARQFATEDNMTVRQILAELQALQAQLNQAKATNPNQENSVGRVVTASTQAEKLARNLRIAQALYDSYVRFLEGTSVEDLTSTANVRVLEPPFVDTDRQFDYRFAALALALTLLLAAIEFYRLRPPLDDRTIVRETYA